MTTYFSQGSVATDLRGGSSFNSIFLHISFLNLTVKKIMKTGPPVTKFCHLVQGRSGNYDSLCIIMGWKILFRFRHPPSQTFRSAASDRIYPRDGTTGLHQTRTAKDHDTRLGITALL